MTSSRIPGSIEPGRVPIMRPSSGVKPIVVATGFPDAIAVAEHPFPRCRLTIRNPPGSRRSRSAARRAQSEWLIPWKPYRRMPHSAHHSQGTG